MNVSKFLCCKWGFHPINTTHFSSNCFIILKLRQRSFFTIRYYCWFENYYEWIAEQCFHTNSFILILPWSILILSHWWLNKFYSLLLAWTVRFISLLVYIPVHTLNPSIILQLQQSRKNIFILSSSSFKYWFKEHCPVHTSKNFMNQRLYLFI